MTLQPSIITATQITRIVSPNPNNPSPYVVKIIINDTNVPISTKYDTTATGNIANNATPMRIYSIFSTPPPFSHKCGDLIYLFYFYIKVENIKVFFGVKMSNFKSFLIEAVSNLQSVPGEAPAALPVEPLLTEPDLNSAEDSENTQEDSIDIYELYPDLANVDISSPCTLADFFATLCESDMENQEAEERSIYVPSVNKLGSSQEF